MHLVTQCPACNTCFRVVPDQLRISDGWVRCGQCSEVFDAAKQMLEPSIAPALPDPTKTPVSASTAQPEPLPEATTAPEPVPEPVFLIQPDDVSSSILAEPAEALRTAQGEPVILHRAEVTVTVGEADASSIPEPAAEAIPETDLVPTPNETPPALDWADLPQSVSPTEPPALSFLTTPRQHTFWRVPMLVLALLLLLALPLQYAYHERNRLASQHTALKPMLQTLCQLLDCRLSAQHGIESMVLDSAAFTKHGKEAFGLTFVVKNNAAIDLAIPDIELTLTNMADQAIVRRILTHTELGAKSDTLQAGSEWHVATVVQVLNEPLLHAVSGYRLLAFYP